MKRYLAYFLAVCMTVSLAACAGSDGGAPADASSAAPAEPAASTAEAVSEESASEPIGGEATEGERVVEFWTLFGGADGEQLGKMVTSFNEEFEGNVHVNATTQDWDNYYTKIKTSILGGQAPDLCISHDEYVNGLVTEGIIQPIDDACAETGVSLDFGNYVEKIEQLKRDDKYYAIPLDCLQILLSYNKTMIADAGLADENGLLKLEEGIDGFLAAVTTLDGALEVPGFAIGISGSTPMYLFNSLYYQYGGEGKLVSEDGKEWIADRDVAINALTAYQQIHQSGMQNVQNIADLFTQEKVAMTIEGAWQMHYFHTNLGDKYGVVSLPKFGDTYKTAVYSHTFVLPTKPERTTEITGAALEFVKWFADNNAQWSEAGSVPAYIPQQSSELFNSYPMHQYFKDAINTPTPFNGTTAFALKGSAEINEPLGKLSRAETTPEQCFDEMSDRLKASFQ